MKKLILIILLLICGSQVSYSQNAIGTMGKTKWSDSTSGLNWWRANLFRSGFTSYSTSFMNGTLSFGSGYGALFNAGNINITNGGAYLLEGVNINTLYPLLSDSNRFWRYTRLDSAYLVRPVFTGLMTGDSIYYSAWKAPSFSTWFYDGDNAIDLTSTYIQQSSKNYISQKIDGVIKVLVDANGLGADSIHGLTVTGVLKFGRGRIDSLYSTKYFSGVTSGNYALNIKDDTLFNFRSPLFADSSYNRLTFNAWTGSATWKLFGKAGTNLFTIDSAGITTTLPITSTSSSTSTYSGGLKGLWLEGASGQYIGLTSKFIMSSSADGKIKLLNYAGNSFTSLAFGLETSSFPMLKRSGTGLLLRLGDDTGYSDLTLNTLTAAGISNSGAVYETNFRTITIAQDTSESTDHTIKLNTASNGVTLVLLPAAQCTGQVLEVILYDATNSGGISISGGATFSDGNTEVNFSSLGDFVVVKSDGTKWIIISYKVV